jgi:carotenoid cleavage dioxygenase-like enzyme
LDESAAIIEFDLLTLETKNEIKNRPGVRGQLTTAHPIADVTTGETVNYTVNVGPQTTYNIFSFNPDVGNVKMISSIPVKEPSYMHSFAMTSGHVILTQCPMVANPLSFLEFSKSVYERYEWKQNLKTRFTIVPRAGGTVIEKETEPLYCYHHVNAFEKDGAIISDLVSYPGPTTLEALMLKNLRSDSPKDLYGGQLKRFSIPLEEGGKVTDQTLSSESLEFPRIDPRRMLSNYRFVYGSGPTSKDGTDFWDQLLKIDTSDGTAKRWKCEGCYPGEAVFVPRPEGEKEDDGLVLSNVLDTGRKISFLLVLDAASFNEIARIDAPQLIPFKFHGNFFRAN